MSRQYDIIVYGATGFSGAIVSHYLARHAPESIRWAVSGRDEHKINALRKRLADKVDAKFIEHPFFIAKPESLLTVAKQTKVLINCVGPFIKFGEPVVAACVEAGTHYVDITGEPAFIRKLIESYESTAPVLIIPAAGFDSVPADMCVLQLTLAAGSSPLTKVEAYVSSTGGGISFGTFSTIVESIARMSTPKREEKKDPKAEDTKKHKGFQKLFPHKSSHTGNWVIPFNFTSDPFIVSRSAKHRNQDFAYAQYLEVSSPIHALIMFLGIFIMFIIIKIPYGKDFLLGFWKEGSGPAEVIREKASTQLVAYGETKNGQKVVSRYAGPEGYNATGLFVSEAAIQIAQNGAVEKNGVLTPSVALGKPYLDRLSKTSVKFAD